MIPVLPFWKRIALRLVPALLVRCPMGNYHWRWQGSCTCGTMLGASKWDGEVWDFRTGRVVKPAMPRKEVSR